MFISFVFFILINYHQNIIYSFFFLLGVFRTTAPSTPAPATTPKPKYYKKPFNQSVRVVTSKSVVTSVPYIKPQALKSEHKESKNPSRPKKVTLKDILRNKLHTVTSNERPENEQSFEKDEEVCSNRIFMQ